jgi:hypothetical protein
MQAGSKIEAIKLVRERTGLGLREAKNIVDSAAEVDIATNRKGLAPGEVPRTGIKIAWLLVAAVGAAALAWQVLRAE